MKERYRDLDVVKGIAMLTVLFNHSFILVPINIHDRDWSIYLQDINATFFVCSFFLVSGYLFNTPSNNKYSFENIFKKLKRLLIPYLSYSVLNYVVKLAAPNLVNRQIDSFTEYAKNVLLYGGELWFLYVLLLIFIVWIALIPLIPKRGIPVVTVFLFIIDIIINGREALGIFMWPRLIHYSVFFLCGYMLRDAKWFRYFINDNRSLTVSCVLFFLLCVVFIKDVQRFILGWPILCFIGCWFIWAIACKLTHYDKIACPLEYVGKNSLGYYWLNGYVLVVVRALVVSIMGITCGPLVVLFVFALCALLETILVMIVKKIPKIGILIGV